MRLGFVVSSSGETTALDISRELDAAYDILTDDNYPPEKAAEILAAAERGGYNPEHFARKMVRLRSALGEP